MEQLGIDFNATGSVMSKSELEELRRKRGECITCGRKCFHKRLFKMIPITDHGRVLNGRCLNCKPLDATENEGGLIPAVSRPATKEDLARFSRSQSNLGLSGPGVRTSSSRRQPSGRSYSGSDTSSRSVASTGASGGRPPNRNGSSSSAPAVAAAVPSSENTLVARGRSGELLDNSSSRGGHEMRRDRSVTPTNSQRPLDSSASHLHSSMADLEGSGRGYASGESPLHSRRRHSHIITDPNLAQGLGDIRDLRDDDMYADTIPQNDYHAGRRAVNEELHHAIEQMGIYADEHVSPGGGVESHPDEYYRSGNLSQRSFGGGSHNDQPSRRGVARHHSGDGSRDGSYAGQPPRHGMLDRGGEVCFTGNNVVSNVATANGPYTGSNRTLSSIGSVDDDMANGRMNSHKRFVPNHAMYDEDAIENNTMRSRDGGMSRVVVHGADERAIDRLHAADGDCAEILAVMRDYLSSTLVQSYALKEISCLHLGPEDQDRLAHFGAMELITDAMHVNPDDIELQIHGCRAIWNGSGTPENQIAFVNAGALDIILANMDRFVDNAEIQECAMGTLSNLAAAEENLLSMVEKGTVGRIVEAMNKHSENNLVQAKGCSAITNMASHLSPLKKNVMDMGGGGAVVICMVMHPDDFDLQEKALRALKNLSSNNDDNKIELANIGGIDAVITAMQVHRDQAGVQEAGAWTLSNLASNNDNKAVIGDCGGIDVVIRAMWVHSDNVKVQEWCCRALYTLTLDRHNSGMVLQVGGISAVVNAMQAHVDSGPVQEMGCAVLCNLAFDESSKMRIVDEEALDAIVLAMVLYSDDAKVQESACEVLLQLAIVENFKSMQASNIGELARAAAAKFPENCKDPAYKLLHVLEGYCEQY